MKAKDIAAELKKIENANGKLDPKDVVEAAKAKDHPFHKFFTWHNANAAASWRIQQARDLIRRCKLTVTVEDVSVKLPVYVRDPELHNENPDETGYVSVAQVSENEESAAATLRYALETAAGHLARYRHLAIVLGVDKRINRVLESIASIQTSLKE